MGRFDLCQLLVQWLFRKIANKEKAMNYKRLLIVSSSLLSFLFLTLSVQANSLSASNEMKQVKQTTCKLQKPKRKYLASLIVNKFGGCDESGCEVESSGGLTSNDLKYGYYLRALSARGNEYVYYLLDTKTFREYQGNMKI